MANLYTPDQEAVFQNMDPEKRAMLQALALRGAQSGPGRVVQQEPTPVPQQQVSAPPPVQEMDPYSLGGVMAQLTRDFGGAQQNSPLLNDIDSRIGLALKNRQPRPQVEYPSAYTPEMIKSITDRLRRNEAFGAGFQMFGDDRAADLGKMLMGGPNADEFAQEVARQEQVRRYQQDQMNMGRGADGELSVLLEARRALDGGGSGGEYARMPVGISKEFDATLDSAAAVSRSRETFKDDYAQVFGEYQSFAKNLPASLVGLGLDEVAAKLATSNDQEERDLGQRMRDSVQWWSGFQRNYELKELHKQFGSALTTGERQRWDAAMVMTPSSDPEVTRRVIADVEYMTQKMLADRAVRYTPMYGPTSTLPGLKRYFDRYGQAEDPYSEQYEGVGQSTPDGRVVNGITYEEMPDG